MGQDKALLRVEGESLLERTSRFALSVSARVVIIGRAAPENWPLPCVEFWSDETPGLGPLGGLQSALQHETAVLALACDLPCLTADALQWLLSQTPGKCGVIVRNGEQLEPLFSIYTDACLPIIEANIMTGRRSLHALIERGNFNIVNAPPEVGEQLFNVNTPEEWRGFGVGASAL